MKFIVDNLLDYGITITANDEDSFFPVTNLFIKTLADKWKTSSAGSKEVQITLPETSSIKEIALVFHNLDSGDQVIIESYPDASGFAGTPIQQELTIRDGIIYWYSDTDYFHDTKYYKLLIEKNSGSYAELGFLFMGVDYYYCPHIAGTMPRNETNSTTQESRGFQNYPAIGESRKSQEFTFRSDKECYENLFAIVQEYILISGIVLPTHNSLDDNEPFFGYISEMGDPSRDHLTYTYSINTKESK